MASIAVSVDSLSSGRPRIEAYLPMCVWLASPHAQSNFGKGKWITIYLKGGLLLRWYLSYIFINIK